MHEQGIKPTTENVLFYLKYKGDPRNFQRFAKAFRYQMVSRLTDPLTEEDKRLSDLFDNSEIQVLGTINGKVVNTILIVRPE